MEELTIQEPTRDEEDGWGGVGGTEQSSEVAEQKGAEGQNREDGNTKKANTMRCSFDSFGGEF